jgi:hypothetical protein
MKALLYKNQLPHIFSDRELFCCLMSCLVHLQHTLYPLAPITACKLEKGMEPSKTTAKRRGHLPIYSSSAFYHLNPTSLR